MLCHYFPASNKDFHFLKGQQNRMQRDKGESAPPLPSQSHRLRHRKRSNEIAPETSKTNGSSLLVDDRNKYKSMRTRVLSSVWMIGGFVFILYLGHLYIWAMIVVIQIFMARELFNLLRKAHEEKELPGFRMLNWHFFFTAMIYVYGRFLSRQLVNTVSSDKVLYRVFSNLIKYHMIICYFMYIAGFVWFIVTLKSKMYKYQFGQYAWTHMILFVVFAQSSFTVANIFEGIFWFLLPASLIVINDIAAYFFGFFFGRTPLIKLSPKKTWEGFIGASITTIISAFLLANVLGRFQWLTCPRKDLSTGWLSCDPGPMFKPKQYTLENWVPSWQVKILIDQKKKAWSRVGCTIMTYGCKDARRREFVNFLVSSGQHTVFLRSVDVIHRVRNASFMTSIIKEVIEEVGPSNVIQIITDNASACVKSGRELELDHPHIFWTPCAAHSLDLLLEDLGKLPWFPLKEFSILPVSKHALAYGLFASSIAPFGGFFASGFKRAFKIKDFGDSIPGHGGITDRMDCQMVMAVFSYIYYQSFIVVQNTSVESFLDQILGNLSFEEQIVLYKQLGDILYRREHGPLL